MWKVLKKGGTAYLNVDSRKDPVPDFLNLETPRFVIYEGNRVFPLKKLVQQLRVKGYDVNYGVSVEKEKNITKRRVLAIFHKNKSKLKLNLKFDEVSSFDLGVLNPTSDPDSMYWGYRSVYKL